MLKWFANMCDFRDKLSIPITQHNATRQGSEEPAGDFTISARWIYIYIYTLPGQKSCTLKNFNYTKLHIIITFQNLTIYTLTNEVTMYKSIFCWPPIVCNNSLYSPWHTFYQGHYLTL